MSDGMGSCASVGLGVRRCRSKGGRERSGVRDGEGGEHGEDGTSALGTVQAYSSEAESQRIAAVAFSQQILKVAGQLYLRSRYFRLEM